MRLSRLALFSLFGGLAMLLVSVPVLAPYVHKIQENIALMEQVRVDAETPPPALQKDLYAAQVRQLVQKANKVIAEARQASRAIKETDAVNAKLAEKKPRPTSQTGFAPSTAPMTNVYSNTDLKADTSTGHVIIDFTPERAEEIEWRAAVASGRCAAYSFVKADGTTTNRLNCPSVVAR